MALNQREQSGQEEAEESPGKNQEGRHYEDQTADGRPKDSEKVSQTTGETGVGGRAEACGGRGAN